MKWLSAAKVMYSKEPQQKEYSKGNRKHFKSFYCKKSLIVSRKT
jgi:hypothetical protein